MFLNNLYTNIVQTKINDEVITDIDYKSLLTNGDNHLYIISTRNLIVFSVYTLIVLTISIIVFKKKMVSDNK